MFFNVSVFNKFLAGLVLFAFGSVSVFAEIILGTVTKIHDGDTLTLETGAGQKKIRLAGIDAPELKQPFGPESRDALRQYVLIQAVNIDTTKLDRYGRAVGKVLLNGEDVNLKQVAAGLAWVYTDYIKEQSVEDRQKYRAAETAANDAHIGLWQDEQPVAPWTYRKNK